MRLDDEDWHHTHLNFLCLCRWHPHSFEHFISTVSGPLTYDLHDLNDLLPSPCRRVLTRQTTFSLADLDLTINISTSRRLYSFTKRFLLTSNCPIYVHYRSPLLLRLLSLTTQQPGTHCCVWTYSLLSNRRIL